MKYTTRLEFTSDWHVGSGTGAAGGVDRGLRRGSDGLPFVPAKTVTGIVRSEAEAIADGLGGTWPGVCRSLFGRRGGFPAEVAFRSLRLSSDVERALRSNRLLDQHFTFSRTSVKIDDLGLAEEKKLFVSELGRKGTRFTGTVEINSHLDQYALTLLALAVSRVERLGGGRRRGRGACTLSIVDEAGTTLAADLSLLDELNPPVRVPQRPSIGPNSGPVDGSDIDGFIDVAVSLTLSEPVVALDRTIGNVRTSHTFIPGTLLLGPLVKRAGGWNRLGPLVFTGDVRVQNAYPVHDGVRLVPSPHCLVTPKRPKNEAMATNALLVDPEPGTKSLRGAYLHADSTTGTVVVEQGLTHFTHAVVDEKTQRPTGSVGGVYTYRAIPRGTELRTAIRLPREIVVDLDSKPFEIRIGASKKDDYGLVTARFHPDTEDVLDDAEVALQETGVVDVWFASDTIVFDESLYPAPTMEGVARSVSQALGITMTVNASASFLRAVRREGWSAASNVPRTTMQCIAAGSIVRLAPPEGTVVDAAALTHLERSGLGERRAEGFGEIVVNAPLLASSEVTLLNNDPSAPRPGSDGLPEWFSALVPVIAEDAARQIAPSVASSVVAWLGLVKQVDKEHRLSKTQLGSLREAASRWRSDPRALGQWIESVEANASRKERWKRVLDHLPDFAERWTTRLTANEKALAEPILALAAEDPSGTANRYVAAIVLTTAVRHALIGGEVNDRG